MANKSEAGLIRRLKPSVRKLFCRAMMSVEAGMPVQQALSCAIQEIPLDAAARRHATDLLYTYLRTEIRLDCIVRRLFPRSSKLPGFFLLLVKAAFCSMLFQPFAPAHAIVHETVSDIRNLYGQGLDRVANGALRNLQRLGSEPLEKDFYIQKGDAPDDVLSRFYSVPLEVGRLVLSQYGEEDGERLLKRSFERPCSGLRLNASRSGFQSLRERLMQAGAQELLGRAAQTSGLVFPAGGFASPAVDLGQLQVQGELSFQAAGSLCVLAELGLFDVQGRVWDACAGFGGKTMAMLEAGKDVVLSTDLSWARLSRLPGEAARLDVPSPCAAIADAACPPLKSFCGTIIADVPCSGLGVLARRPDIRRRIPDFAFYTKTQKNILQALCRVATPGSVVAYITCTINKDENGRLVRDVCGSVSADIEAEWETPADSPYEGMYGARLRIM